MKCSQQERTIQVSIPAEILVKDYPYNAEVELINPVADTVANANYRGADVEWYIKADDIVLKNKAVSPQAIHRTRSAGTAEKIISKAYFYCS